MEEEPSLKKLTPGQGRQIDVVRSYLKENGLDPNFERYEKRQLADVLEQFYKRVKRKDGQPFKVERLRSIRSTLNKHLKITHIKHGYLNRSGFVNLSSDLEFATANLAFAPNMLGADGYFVGTEFPSIDNGDLKKLYNSGVFNQTNAEGLQNKVWFELMWHVCQDIDYPANGVDVSYLQQLKKDDFAIGVDDSDGKHTGKPYVYLVKNATTDDMSVESTPRGRMYATGDKNCPVAAFEKYISKLDPECDVLFQTPKLMTPTDDAPWYNNIPLYSGVLEEFMSKLSSVAGLSKRYTNHSIRSTRDEWRSAGRELSIPTDAGDHDSAKKQKLSDLELELQKINGVAHQSKEQSNLVTVPEDQSTAAPAGSCTSNSTPTSTPTSPSFSSSTNDAIIARTNHDTRKSEVNRPRIKRPLNAFFLWATEERKKIHTTHPAMAKDISKIIGDKWKTMTSAEKQPYLDEQARLREEFSEKYPDHKFKRARPRRHRKHRSKPHVVRYIRDEKKILIADDSDSQRRMAVQRRLTPYQLYLRPFRCKYCKQYYPNSTQYLQHQWRHKRRICRKWYAQRRTLFVSPPDGIEDLATVNQLRSVDVQRVTETTTSTQEQCVTTEATPSTRVGNRNNESAINQAAQLQLPINAVNSAMNTNILSSLLNSRMNVVRSYENNRTCHLNSTNNRNMKHTQIWTGPLQCPDCNEWFDTKATLTHHYLNVHEQIEIPPTSTFRSYNNKTGQLNSTAGENMDHDQVSSWPQCHNCYERFNTLAALTEHYQNVHAQVPPTSMFRAYNKILDLSSTADGSMENGQIRPQCSVCHEIFNTMAALKEHYQKTHAQTMTEPQYTVARLTKHNQKTHAQTTTEPQYTVARLTKHNQKTHAQTTTEPQYTVARLTKHNQKTHAQTTTEPQYTVGKRTEHNQTIHAQTATTGPHYPGAKLTDYHQNIHAQAIKTTWPRHQQNIHVQTTMTGPEHHQNIHAQTTTTGPQYPGAKLTEYHQNNHAQTATTGPQYPVAKLTEYHQNILAKTTPELEHHQNIPAQTMTGPQYPAAKLPEHHQNNHAQTATTGPQNPVGTLTEHHGTIHAQTATHGPQNLVAKLTEYHQNIHAHTTLTEPQHSVAKLTEHHQNIHAHPTKKGPQCPVCHKVFNTMAALGKHYLKTHEQTTMTTGQPGPQSLTCRECYISFNTRDELKKHYRNIHRQTATTGPQCRICYGIFSTEVILTEHYEIIHGQTAKAEPQCQICYEVFSTEAKLVEHHQTTHTGLQCPICYEVFSTGDKLTEHYQKTHTQPRTERRGSQRARPMCSECSISFNTIVDLTEHYQIIHVQKTRPRCDICYEVFSTVAKLAEHYQTIHGQTATHGPQNLVAKLTEYHQNIHAHTTLTEPQQCQICYKVFSTKAELTEHYRTIHVQTATESTCRICYVCFGTVAELREHHRNCHAQTETTEPQCQICYEIFSTAAKLTEHYRTIHTQTVSGQRGPQRPICAECFISFNTIAELTEHYQTIHAQKTRPQCQICYEVFSTIAKLTKHYQRIHVHTATGPQCRICYEVCSTVAELREHNQTIHKQGPQSPTCSECCISFNTEAELTEHNQTLHPAPEPQCPFCYETFNTTEALTEHKKIHTQKYKCGVCDMRFHVERDMLTHQATHTMCDICSICCKSSRRPMDQCTICNMCFCSSDCGQKHKQVNHTKTNVSTKSAQLEVPRAICVNPQVKSFLCHHCDVWFKDAGSLAKHEQLYNLKTSKKQYRCQYCKEKFKDAASCFKHVLRHRPPKSFLQCPTCNGIFLDVDRFQSHECKTMTLYRCPDCKNTFTDASSCANHVSICTKHETSKAKHETSDASHDDKGDATQEMNEASHGTHETSRPSNKMSHATHEMSYATQETSHATHETSHATHETSHATHKTSHATHETSQATLKMNCTTHETSHATHETSHATDETSQATQKTSQATHETNHRQDASSHATHETSHKQKASSHSTHEMSHVQDASSHATHKATSHRPSSMQRCQNCKGTFATEMQFRRHGCMTWA